MSSSVESRFPAGTFLPSPGRGHLGRMLATQAGVEVRLAFRNGEQVMLTLLIPLALLVGLTLLNVVPLPAPRVAMVAPGVLALAVLSTAFTGQAISLGFDRRYGVIRRLAATALPRWLLVAGRLVAVLGVVAIQLVVLGAVAVALGWRPAAAGVGWGLLLVLLGCAAFGGLGILLGGTLRAEIVLAVANLLWFVFAGFGALTIEGDMVSRTVRSVARLTPSGALTSALSQAMNPSVDWFGIAVLAAWGLVASLCALRWFRFS
jgi:ABC-2 type transport system permease protein